MKKTTALLLISLMSGLFGCRESGSGKRPSLPPDPGKSDSKITTQLKSFSNPSELTGYLKEVQESQGDNSSEGASSGEATSENPSSADSSDSTNQEITNNQESGVDEGGLVKNYKDFLITLRRGRLVTVRVNEDGSLTKIDQEEMTPEGLDDAVWYDELLISDDLVLVVGYRYSIIPSDNYKEGATELNFFRISEEGGLSRLETYFFESSDYYSWRNYAGRLIEGKLVLYFPFYQGFLWNSREELQIPRIFRHAGGGNLLEVGRLFEPADIYRPLKEITWPTFHTLLACDLSQTSSLNCSAQVVIDSWFRELYVTKERAYLWIDEGSSRLYALELDGSGSGVAEVEGNPIDQFSLSEREGGVDALTVAYEDSPCDSQDTSWFKTHYRYLSVPFSSFASELTGATGGGSTCLTGQGVWVNRFSPTYLAYAGNREIMIVERATGTATTLELDYEVQRIELAGQRFLIAGQQGSFSLEASPITLATVTLGPTPALTGVYEIPGISQSEWRSHGYAYYQGETFEGFGLATQFIREVGDCQAGLCWDGYEVIPSIHFFTIDKNGQIALSGGIAEHTFDQEGKTCTTSCVDWYGNTRPIFLGDRVIGLIGDQMASGSLTREGILQTDHFLQIFTGETL